MSALSPLVMTKSSTAAAKALSYRNLLEAQILIQQCESQDLQMMVSMTYGKVSSKLILQFTETQRAPYLIATSDVRCVRLQFSLDDTSGKKLGWLPCTVTR